MCCYTSDRVSALLALMLVMCGLASPAASADAPENRFLDVWSQGYSRFEIDNGDIIAHFTEGVEFEYLGCHAQAQSLEYNQSTQVARAVGEVVVFAAGGELTAQEMVFDGGKGTLGLKGGVSGLHSSSGYSFNANEAEVLFPPDNPDFELQNLEIRLIGEITVASATGDMLSTRDISYSGKTGEFKSMAPFLLTAAAGYWQDEETSAIDLSGARAYGMELHGVFDSDAGLQALGARDLSIKATGLEITLDSLSAEQIQSDRSGNNISGASLLLGRLAGWLQPRDGSRVDLLAQNGQAEVDADGIASLQLGGKVNLLYAGTPVETNSLVLVRVGDRYEVRMPANVAVEFDLAEITGADPIDRQELQAQLTK